MRLSPRRLGEAMLRIQRRGLCKVPSRDRTSSCSVYTCVVDVIPGTKRARFVKRSEHICDRPGWAELYGRLWRSLSRVDRLFSWWWSSP